MSVPQPVSKAEVSSELVALEYRPGVRASIFCSMLFVATAALLVWIGFVVSPDDRDATEGLTRILFTVVPIPWFSWCMATVFLVLAIVLILRTRRREPSLTVDDDGLTLADRTYAKWSELESVEISKDGLLLLAFSDNIELGRNRHRAILNRAANKNTVAFSSFDLGADTAVVQQELEQRLERNERVAGRGRRTLHS